MQASANEKNVKAEFDRYRATKEEDNTNIFGGGTKVGLSSEAGMRKVDGTVETLGKVRDTCSSTLLVHEHSPTSFSH